MKKSDFDKMNVDIKNNLIKNSIQINMKNKNMRMRIRIMTMIGSNNMDFRVMNNHKK